MEKEKSEKEEESLTGDKMAGGAITHLPADEAGVGGGDFDLRDEDRRRSRKSGGPHHGVPNKHTSLSEKDRKIGHRRINEEGQVSYKKIETNQLMGSIQLGIHDSVGRCSKYPSRDLLMHDFMTVETVQFPKSGGTTLAHTFSDFTFRTYAPVAFRYFRDLFGIPPDDFMVSICNEPMRELSNPGASGSIFYLTHDDEFILKTVQLKEAEFLQKLLPGYYMNLQQNPRTLLPKFFGMFCYQCNQKNIRLTIMNNLLPSRVKMHLKFDLKGSTYKRKASRHERVKNSPTFKDLDFMEMLPEGLLLEPETYSALVTTLRRDCRVLESFKIMDYSLLVGIHNLDQAAKDRMDKASPSPSADGGQGKGASQLRHKLVAHSTAMESIQATSDPVDIPQDLPPGGIPARNHKGERLLLFVGIIDILQSYRLRKKLEHTFKAMIHDGDTVSVHRPGFYAERFMGFMSGKVFKKIPSSLKHSPSKRGKSLKSKSSASAGGQVSGLAKGQTSDGGAALRPDVVPATNGGGVGGAHPDGEAMASGPESHHNQGQRHHSVTPGGSRHSSGGRYGRTVSGSSGGSAWDSPLSSSAGGRGHGQGDVVSISDVRLEPRHDGVGSLGHHGTPSRLSTNNSSAGRTTTPTWTEGTPSYTESTYSGDLGYPHTPQRGRDPSAERRSSRRDLDSIPTASYQETEM